MSGTVAKPYKILVAGGSYAGLSLAVNLLEKCDSIDSPIAVDITIVDERDGFYHLIGSPLAFAQKAYAEKAWVPFEDIKILQRPNVRFIRGSLDKVDCEAQTAVISEKAQQGEDQSSSATTRTESYDFFLAATGLRRVFPVVAQSLSRKLYLEETGSHIDAVVSSKAPVLVVGGGAVGIEMAAELKHVQPNLAVTLAHSRDKLLSAEPLPDNVKECAADLCRQAGVEVLLNHRLIDTEDREVAEDGSVEVEFTNGHKMRASHVIVAISKSAPSTSYLPASALNSEGLVNVRASMQFLSEASDSSPKNADRHFAVGDLINWSGIKRCGGAMWEGKLAALNMHQIMARELGVWQGEEEQKFAELQEIPPMIGLAVGGTALSYGPGEGIKHGPQVMKTFFEEDLGFRIVWDHLRLGEVKA